MAFLRDAQQDGYPKEVERYYGWTVDGLELRWPRYAFPDCMQ